MTIINYLVSKVVGPNIHQSIIIITLWNISLVSSVEKIVLWQHKTAVKVQFSLHYSPQNILAHGNNPSSS